MGYNIHNDVFIVLSQHLSETKNVTFLVPVDKHIGQVTFNTQTSSYRDAPFETIKVLFHLYSRPVWHDIRAIKSHFVKKVEFYHHCLHQRKNYLYLGPSCTKCVPRTSTLQLQLNFICILRQGFNLKQRVCCP